MAGTATGIAFNGRPTNGANRYIDSLVTPGVWRDTSGVSTPDGKTTITFAAVQGADPYQAGKSGYAWQGYELTALKQALASWESVANLKFVDTGSHAAVAGNGADAWFWLRSDAYMGSGTLGMSELPGAGRQEPLYTEFNRQDGSWTAAGLAKGGYAYITLIHEIGHLLGLDHPHEAGTAFPGVTSDASMGTNNLNQGIFTTMSYIDGWRAKYPGHAANGYGWQGTPMAFDIAAIQVMYGANMSYRTGNDTYVLPKVNGAGTFWACIWDAGGSDTLTNAGSTKSCNIDLAAAPLTGANAGGYISYNAGVIGGFTIANKVVIENATGGGAADTLYGNAAVNTIRGGGGSDWLTGRGGKDILFGDGGNDAFQFVGLGDCGDTINDFFNAAGNNDLFRIKASGFAGGLVAGQTLIADQILNSANGNLAQDAEDRFIYRQSDKTLWFDKDGVNGAPSVLVADLQANAPNALGIADFQIF